LLSVSVPHWVQRFDSCAVCYEAGAVRTAACPKSQPGSRGQPFCTARSLGATKRAPRTTMNRRLRAGLRAEGSPGPSDEKKGRLDRSSQNNPRVAPRPDDDDIVSPRPDVSGPCPACPPPSHRRCATTHASWGVDATRTRVKARVAAQHAVDATRERKTQIT
jgi:hypothetical protein